MGGKVTGYRNGWVESKCLFARWNHDNGKDNKPSFAIHSHNNKKSIYKCFSCGKGGDLLMLQIDLSLELRKDVEYASKLKMAKALEYIANEMDELEFDASIKDYEDDEKAKIEPYPEEWLASFKPAWAFSAAREYLHTRDVTEALSAALSIRFDPIRQRVCFPYRDHKGMLMGLQGRDITGASSLRYLFYTRKNIVGDTYMNSGFWLGEHHLDLDRPVVLSEGPFDYASIYRLYQNTAASFTSGLSVEKLKRLSDASEVVTFYDTGKGGDVARATIRKVLKGIPIIDVYPENHGGDPGSMSEDEVKYHLSPHLKLGSFLS